MSDLIWVALVVATAILSGACNSSVPQPASMEIPSASLRLTIVRTATDPFLPRYSLTLMIEGPEGCTSTTELFPDTGYAGRRNIYLAAKGLVYVVGQFDARVIDPPNCRTILSEFRHLDREVVFLGSFDENDERRWSYFPASQLPERPFEKR